ncbi:hypothetical protein [Haloferax volcanii]|uniref:Uncharacterized protein n=3 Tax=Haloferax volcanii TaxID=2246 RepID=A0A384KDF2_HALVD|nr:hypothetical protein [Haloferax volcanii]ADE03308.2 uncharacterized protein HVO_2987 [Haloferax volcanii DS2]ELY24593.1 hypothetical protein C498_18100 [Haloferax volcanii DS2]MBS8118849.1 hypothetical protein [Haloferax volcanii]MBS8123863.1 hypothetical protein [Haloferax volcanii]MBS8127732.1 hypothetical protein [Haloferax volcanii]
MGHGATASPKRDVVTISMLVLAGPFLATSRPVTAIIGALFGAAGVYGTVESLAAAVAAYLDA